MPDLAIGDSPPFVSTWNLEEVSPGEVLLWLAGSGREGKLVVEHARGAEALEVSGGALLQARSSDFEARLGPILVRSGACSQDDVERAARATEETGEAIGHALVRLGLAPAARIREALLRQIDEVIGNVLQLSRGSAIFREQAPEIEPMVREPIRRILFGAMKRFGVPASLALDASRVVSKRASMQDLFECDLDDSECELLDLAAGGRTLADLERLGGFGPSLNRQILQAMVACGLLEVARPVGA